MNSFEMTETIGFMIVSTGKHLLKTINDAFAHITKDITFEQLGVLYSISRSKTSTLIQQDIANYLNKTKSAILRSIDILEQKGFVKRLPVKGDRRKNLITLTVNGKEIVDSMHKKFLEYDGFLKDGIREEELLTCLNVLDRINRKCK